MAFGIDGIIRRCLGIVAIIWLAMPAWSGAQSCPTCTSTGAACGHQAGCLSHFHCPPAYRYWQEGPPRLHFKCACPHPLCNPCQLPNWGYFETCWSPYPFPPDWSHCPTTPPAAYINLNPHQHLSPPAVLKQTTNLSNQQPISQLPPPAPANPSSTLTVLPQRNLAPSTNNNELPQPRPFDISRPGLE